LFLYGVAGSLAADASVNAPVTTLAVVGIGGRRRSAAGPRHGVVDAACRIGVEEATRGRGAGEGASEGAAEGTKIDGITEEGVARS